MEIYQDGIVYTLSKKQLTAIVSDCDLDLKGDIVLPSQVIDNGQTYNVTAIGEHAFAFRKIQSVVIPEGVQKIGYCAFKWCRQLADINLPRSLVSIGAQAFMECIGPFDISISSSVKKIGASAFDSQLTRDRHLNSIVVESGNKVYDSRNNCNALIHTKTNTLLYGCAKTIIPNGIRSINEEAFSNCVDLVSIDIPESVKDIGDCAFRHCANLTSVTLHSGIKNLGWNAFAHSAIKQIYIPDTVRKIDINPFEGCALESIIVDSNNRVYDSRKKCNAIIETATNTLVTGCSKTIIPNNIEHIGKCAFAYSEKLVSIDIPDSVKDMDILAFAACSSLSSVILHSGIENIGSGAFSGCALKHIHISESVKTSLSRRFRECPLESIVVDRNNPLYDSRDNCNAIIETATNTLVAGCATTKIPSSVTHIGDDAFLDCIDITHIDIPHNITTIGKGAFCNCKKLESITFSEGLKEIGEYVFSGCKNLTKLVFPNSVEKIGEMTSRYDKYNLSTLVFPANAHYVPGEKGEKRLDLFRLPKLTYLQIPKRMLSYILQPDAKQSLEQTVSDCGAENEEEKAAIYAGVLECLSQEKKNKLLGLKLECKVVIV